MANGNQSCCFGGEEGGSGKTESVAMVALSSDAGGCWLRMSVSSVGGGWREGAAAAAFDCNGSG